jgi:hypothetical protein
MNSHSLYDYLTADVVIASKTMLDNHFAQFCDTEFGRLGLLKSEEHILEHLLMNPNGQDKDAAHPELEIPASVLQMCELLGIDPIKEIFSMQNRFEEGDVDEKTAQAAHNMLFREGSVFRLWRKCSKALGAILGDDTAFFGENQQKLVETLQKIKGLPPWFLLWDRKVVDEVHELAQSFTQDHFRKDKAEFEKSFSKHRKERSFVKRFKKAAYGEMRITPLTAHWYQEYLIAASVFSIPSTRDIWLSGTPDMVNMAPVYTMLAQWPLSDPRVALRSVVEFYLDAMVEKSMFFAVALQIFGRDEENWNTEHLTGFKEGNKTRILRCWEVTTKYFQNQWDYSNNQHPLAKLHLRWKNCLSLDTMRDFVLENTIKSDVVDLSSLTLTEHVHRFDLTSMEKLYISSKIKERAEGITPSQHLQLLCYFNAEKLIDASEVEPLGHLVSIEKVAFLMQKNRKVALEGLNAELEHLELTLETRESDLIALQTQNLSGKDPTPAQLTRAVDAVDMAQRRCNECQSRRDILQTEMVQFESHLGDLTIAKRKCTICDSRVVELMSPACQHQFCRGCAEGYVERNERCPICRDPLSLDQMIELYDDDEENNVVSADISKDISAVAKDLSAVAKDRVEFPLRKNVEKFGSKLARVVALIQKIKSQNEKVIIFSQWFSLSRALETMLEAEAEITTVANLSKHNTSTRNAILSKFCDVKNREYDVLLLSIEDSTAGMNLWSANHCIFMHGLLPPGAASPPLASFYRLSSKKELADKIDPLVGVAQAWKDQAIARIYRLGQTKNCHVHWFLVNDSPEA